MSNKNCKIIYMDGIFDCFHYGHARAFKQAKMLFPKVYLIVGVSSDMDTHALKGLTVMNEDERAESVGHCRYVDKVIKCAPWIITNTFMKTHNIDYVAHDAKPYVNGATNSIDCYHHLKKAGKFIATHRTTGISTSGLINRIVRDYELFLMRQLTRGYSAKEMNITEFKQLKLKVKMKLNKNKKKFLEKSDKMWDNVEKRLQEFISLFELNINKINTLF